MTFSFRPRLIDALKGYDRSRFIGDVGAGLTVAVVALPLAMAFAIASGLSPQAGIFTTIIAGTLVALLGGSRVQIGGPAGAFIVIVYGIVQQYGVGGLIVATLMSGGLLFLMGLFRLGTLVRFIPIAVVIGFTNGIAVLIGLSQVKDFMGLAIPHMPADFFGIIHALASYSHTLNPWALAIATLSLLGIAVWQHGGPALGRRSPFVAKLAVIPGAMVALVMATAATACFGLPVETIGSRFGGIPAELPTFSLPAFDWSTLHLLLMPAVTLALLGAIESLLCARVADGMIGDRHDPNQELMAQGIANVAAPLLGGMPATGTIARTVTNVKNGATTPVAGIVHAAVLLVVILVAAPLASSIPLACLAAILMYVAWNMGDWRAFVHLRHYRRTYRSTLLAVFLLTIVFDLTIAVQIGILAACLTFIYRMSELARAERLVLPALAGHTPDIQAWRFSGAIFFGSTPLIETLDGPQPARVLILDFTQVPYMDSTGADALRGLVRQRHAGNAKIIISGLARQPLDLARRSGLLALIKIDLQPDLESAVAVALTTNP
ncbi:MAG: STAS domain-containing protein [Nevskiaceae bacterium]|nr:MAG: STAS domain-containing protein [Nevskiaceae bacterium]TBR72002.1 MAG: STAS domain-containing protein [Nevskiaceae bacterium]